MVYFSVIEQQSRGNKKLYFRVNKQKLSCNEYGIF